MATESIANKFYIGINCFPGNNKHKFKRLLASLLVKPCFNEKWFPETSLSGNISESPLMVYYRNEGDFIRKNFIGIPNMKLTNMVEFLLKKRFEKISNNVCVEFLIDGTDLPNKELMDIIEEFKQLHPNVIISGTSKHTNLTINRNIFLKNHKTDYVCFCDDDDISCSIDTKLELFEIYIHYIYTRIKDTGSEVRKEFLKYTNSEKIIKSLDDIIESKKDELSSLEIMQLTNIFRKDMFDFLLTNPELCVIDSDKNSVETVPGNPVSVHGSENSVSEKSVSAPGSEKSISEKSILVPESENSVLVHGSEKSISEKSVLIHGSENSVLVSGSEKSVSENPVSENSVLVHGSGNTTQQDKTINPTQQDKTENTTQQDKTEEDFHGTPITEPIKLTDYLELKPYSYANKNAKFIYYTTTFYGPYLFTTYTTKNNSCNISYGIWSLIIPPWTIDNYTNVKEVKNEDVIYDIMHHLIRPKSCLAIKYTKPIYFYLSPSYNDYKTITTNDSIASLGNSMMFGPDHKFKLSNKGFEYDDIVEYKRDGCYSHEFVSGRDFRGYSVEDVQKYISENFTEELSKGKNFMEIWHEVIRKIDL